MRAASTIAVLRRLAGGRGEWARAALLGVLGAAGEVALALSFAALARSAADDAPSLRTLWPIAAVLGGAATLRMVAQIATRHLVATSGIETARSLRRVGLDAVLRADARGLEPATEVLSRWMERVPRAVQAHQATVGLVAWSMHSLLLGALVVATAPAIGLAMIAVLVASGGVAILLARRVRAMARGLAPAQRHIARTLERVTRRAWEIRALRTAELERARLAREVDAHAAEQRRVAVASAIAAASPLVPGLVAIGALAGVGLAGGMGVAELVAMLYALVRLASSLTAAGHSIGAISAAGPALEEVGRELEARGETPSPAREREVRRSGPCAISIAGLAVEVAELAVLREVELDIAPGEAVAIVGPSGAGKTTLLRAVLGVLEPTRGRVRVDGLAPREWAEAGGRVGLVTAEPLLFAGTLRENLGYGHGEIDDDALLAAVARAHVSSVARDGLDRRIGEGGEGVSTGERQRLALARALVGEPPLLVLDEPTSGLDAPLEQEIAELIRGLSGRCTVLLATHRPALLAACDRVVELAPGAEGATLRPSPQAVSA